jgi:predicted nucleic-acid-binding Zn-ribbon protein
MNYEKCLRCGNRMLGGKSLPIPKDVRLPMGITVSVQQYLPEILQRCTTYRTLVCEYCRYVEFFAS